ncbi:hypothetical protein F2Q70_00036690 [Brassica cretica]|uniref:Uncharacterized protein n=1 Tax=Brassica cretica TaxID=69181 RepID=A0A8S9JRF8_BRACR|nr:hypothetical protein F2Q70_00036690 [Brassica cretica]
MTLLAEPSRSAAYWARPCYLMGLGKENRKARTQAAYGGGSAGDGSMHRRSNVIRIEPRVRSIVRGVSEEPWSLMWRRRLDGGSGKVVRLWSDGYRGGRRLGLKRFSDLVFRLSDLWRLLRDDGSRRQRVVGLFNVGVVNRWRKPGGGTRWSLISQHRRQLCGYAGGKVSRHLKLGDAIPFAFCCRYVRLSIRF